MFADPSSTILAGTYARSCSHGCGEGQRAGKGKCILGWMIGGKCVGSQHICVHPLSLSQSVCLRKSSQNSFERNPCNRAAAIGKHAFWQQFNDLSWEGSCAFRLWMDLRPELISSAWWAGSAMRAPPSSSMPMKGTALRQPDEGRSTR